MYKYCANSQYNINQSINLQCKSLARDCAAYPFGGARTTTADHKNQQEKMANKKKEKSCVTTGTDASVKPLAFKNYFSRIQTHARARAHCIFGNMLLEREIIASW